MDDNSIKQCKDILKKNHFQPIRKIGKGGFGVVFLASKQSYPEICSVKCTNKKLFVKKPLLRRYIKQEIEIMRGLKHPNIVQLFQAFQDEGWIFMVMEYCDQGNLAAIQAQKQNKIFHFDQCQEIVREIIDGLLYMHSQNVLHRDIKPQNILRTRVKKVSVTKICDLGFSREAAEDANTFCGTSSYMAPEILAKKTYDHNVDIWALGVLIFDLLFGYVPFRALNLEQEIKKRCCNGFSLEKSKRKMNPSISELQMKKLSEMFKSIFELDPKKRLSLEGIASFMDGENIFPEKPLRKILSTKTTDTQISEEDSSFQMQQVEFVQKVFSEVERKNFLSKIEISALKFYLDKVSLSILSCDRNYSNLSQKQQDMIQKLELTHDEDLLKLTPIFMKWEILQNCKPKSTIIFKSYKEEYRLVVGHAFSRAHQYISDYEEKARMKLKLLCCHLINRVFEEENQKKLYKHFFSWKKKKGLSHLFELGNFWCWVEQESVENVIDTIEIINNRFYRKGKNV